MVFIQGTTGPQVLTDGAPNNIRTERAGGMVVQDAHGPLAEAAMRGNLFSAHASITSMVIYTTAAGTGGPFIWNGSTNKVVSVIKVGWVQTVAAATTGGMIGLATGTGMTTAPANTAIGTTGNMLTGGPPSAATAYSTATSTNAATARFIPLAQVSTAAISTVPSNTVSFDFKGSLIVPPTCWVSLASSVTFNAPVHQTFIIWEELPL